MIFLPAETKHFFSVLCCALWYLGGRVTLYHAFFASCASFDLSPAGKSVSSSTANLHGRSQWRKDRSDRAERPRSQRRRRQRSRVVAVLGRSLSKHRA